MAVQIANERTKTMIRDGEIGPEQSATVYLITGGRDWLQLRAEIARVSVRQTLNGHGWQPRPLVWSFIGWRQACVASRSRDYGTLGIQVEGGGSGGWSDEWRSGGMSPLIG